MTHTSTKFIVGMWVSGTFIAILAVLFILAVIGLITSNRYDRGDMWVLTGIVAAALAATVGGTVLAMWPLDMQYHRYERHSGVVSDVGSRLLGDGKSTTQNFPIVFRGDPLNVYRCDDTRCATVRPGDAITLDCIRSYQWNAAPGWVCNFRSVDSRTER
jgi:hypothetical protein